MGEKRAVLEHHLMARLLENGGHVERSEGLPIIDLGAAVLEEKISRGTQDGMTSANFMSFIPFPTNS